jgi:putative addiction module component (TIGR02574 family)
MSSALDDEIDKLDPLGRIRLAQALLESVASQMSGPPLTHEQRAELRARLNRNRRHPDEPLGRSRRSRRNSGGDSRPALTLVIAAEAARKLARAFGRAPLERRFPTREL